MLGHRIRQRLKAALQRSQLEEQMAEEMRFHLEARAHDLMQRGLSAKEAARRARLEFGPVEKYKEVCREERGLRLLDTMRRDLRYGVRQLAKAPTFSTAAILILALGIGANTAMFSVVDRLLLRSLPYPEGDALTMIYESGWGNPRNSVSPANWLDWMEQSRSFESMAAWNTREATLTGMGEPEQWSGQLVSAEFFPLLRVQPLLGRIFVAENDRPGARPVIILSHSLWQRRFAGDEEVIGRVVELNATGCEIIGVMPPGFQFVDPEIDYWEPYSLDRGRAWRENAGRFMAVIGRLRPGVALPAAQDEMQRIMRRLEEIHPFNQDTSATVVPLRDVLTGEVRVPLLVLFCAVSLLLLIVCVNVANLLLARASYRRREFAIRASLGAGRGAIVRQLLVESLVLASMGGMLGVPFAYWGISVLLALTPDNLLRVTEVPLDPWILLYTCSLCVVTGIVFGLVPALVSTRGPLVGQLRSGGYTSTHSAPLRQGLIIAQVAMTIILLCGAGLLMRSLLALRGNQTGLNAENVLTVQVQLPAARYRPPQRVVFFQRAVESLNGLPGVQAVGAGSSLPVVGPAAGTAFSVLGEPELPLNEQPTTRVRSVMPGYFKTLGIPVLRGRELSDDDLRDNAPPVFIVNESFVRLHLAARDPLSASISVLMQEENPYGRIVGVVGNVNEGSLRSGAEPTVFYSYRQLTYPGMTLFIRAAHAGGLAQAAVQLMRDLDPDQPVSDVNLLESVFAESVARERLAGVVSSAFAVAGLVLACLGLYGLLAFTVAEQTREIGLRIAFGARASSVVRMILSKGLRLVLVGGLLGVAGAVAVTSWMESLLFGVTPHDPPTFLAVLVLISAVSTLAVLVPALRAARIDPMRALRQD